MKVTQITWGEEVRIRVPKGQVLFITQVTPTPANNALDWILRAESKNELGVIAQYHPDTPATEYSKQPKFLQRDMNIVLEGGDDEVVNFDANGGRMVRNMLDRPSEQDPRPIARRAPKACDITLSAPSTASGSSASPPIVRSTATATSTASAASRRFSRSAADIVE